MSRRRQMAGLLCAAASLVHGQTVQWDPPGGALAVGHTVEFDLVCRDCQLRAPPDPPQIDGLVMRLRATSAGYDNVTGMPISRYVFSGYWTKMEDLVIPSFIADTDHGGVRVPEARFEAIPSTVGRNREPLSQAASAVLSAPAEVWQGEVFPVTYTIDADANYEPDWSHTAPDWLHGGADAEAWTAPENHDVMTAAGKRSGLQYLTRAAATRAGELTLQPDRELVNLNVGVSAFGPPNPEYEQFSVPCEPVTVRVKPLPPPPPGFLGGVGHFTIATHVAPQSAAPRDPITWTIELSGTGNWPQIKSLPGRAVPAGFRIVHPQFQRAPAPDKVFDGKVTEDLVIVPSKAGHYVLPAVTWVYFDPDGGKYATISSDPVPIDISGPADESETGGGPEERLPSDPLPLGDVVSLPLSGPVFAALLLIPFGLLTGGWLLLALRRAHANDPGRARREAWTRQHRRLLAIQEAAKAGDAARLRPLLLAWQHDSVLVWDLPERSPTPESIGDRSEGALWAEAEVAIYGPEAKLPPDWLVRADQSLEEMPPPKFYWERLFSPRNLFPFVALLAVLAPARAAAPESSPMANYTAGRFADAERAWRQANPADAAGKHDVSVALAQQGKWGDAAPFAAEAFVRHPDQRLIRAQFRAVCDHTSIEPGPLGRFLAPGAGAKWAELASPAFWQRVVVVGAWVAAIGLLLLLLRGYELIRSPAWVLAGWAIFTLSLCAVIVAWFSVRTYGAAASGDALWVAHPVVMRSIPTDVLSGQATTPLSPGAIGVPDKSFLTWTRLRFDDGTTGWVRRSDLIPLWR